MLHIYYGDGSADKEKFIFENIDPKRKTILIVPDQFSLQAERDAFRLMGRESLTDLMIVDFSALGHKVVHEIKGHEPEIIDKYGRHMLLTILVEEISEDLQTYGSLKNRNSFIDHVNTMISQLKRYEIGLDDLQEICSRLDADPEGTGYGKAYLAMKMADILKIYTAYEEAVKDIYQDSEDYITYYAELIPESDLVRGADVWIYGFDTFTPRNMTVIGKILSAAENLSVVLTAAEGPPDGTDPVRLLTLNDGEDLFDITGTVSSRLEDMAHQAGIECRRHHIYEKATNLWNTYPDSLNERISLVQTSDHYREAERAAAYIRHLVRDEGYRYGEIAVICNDSGELGGMLTRALQRIDVPVFSDRRRSVLHQPVVSFLLSFLEVIQRGYQSDGIMGMIKSGLLDIDPMLEDLMENYTFEFGIRSGRWNRPFKYRSDRYTDEDMEALNGLREFLVDTCDRARDGIGRRNSAEEKIRGLQSFLEDDFTITDRICHIISDQTEMGLDEAAAETTQIWNGICEIFQQIIRVVGQRRISNRTMAEMIRAGLTSMDIGLVPFSGDSLLMGTLQRTRPGKVRALIVVGAEEGLLPLHGHDEGLLTRPEMEVLEEMDLELARRDKVSSQEEQLAVYRMFSLPTEKLYVSCSQRGSGGGAARPSSLFEKLKKYQNEILGDIERSDMMEGVVDRNMTISYLAQAVRSRRFHEEVDPRWDRVEKWYRDNDPLSLNRMWHGTSYNNRAQALGEDMSRALFTGDKNELTVSASRLELFNGCPFAHFIQYGLRPVEQRLFEVGGREIGDIYHQCIMRYCQEITEMKSSSQGDWDELTREDCGEMIRRIIREEKGYQEGVFESDEESRFRLERVTEICGDIAWVITEQIRQGQIRSMKFEEAFGYGGELPAMEFDIDGRKARIVGRIDRVDVLGSGEEGSIRIIDYKTGSKDMDPEEMRAGYQLQLAVYMEAARGQAAPAGVFYFKIKEHLEEGKPGTKLKDEELQSQLKKAYRLEGIAVDDPAILRDMDKSLVPGDKYESMVIPVEYKPKNEKFAPKKGGILMSSEEFSCLLEESRNMARDICRRIYEGEIKIDPHKTNKKNRFGEEKTACDYCDFGSICMHDL